MRRTTIFPTSFPLLLVIFALLPFSLPASLLRNENLLTANWKNLPANLMSSNPNLPSSTDLETELVERLASSKAGIKTKTWSQLPALVDQLRRVKKTGESPRRRLNRFPKKSYEHSALSRDQGFQFLTNIQRMLPVSPRITFVIAVLWSKIVYSQPFSKE